MKVRDLIRQLQQLDPDSLVIINGYEDGVVEPLPPQTVKIRLNVFKKEYYGPHQVVKENEPGISTVNAVYLARPED